MLLSLNPTAQAFQVVRAQSASAIRLRMNPAATSRARLTDSLPTCRVEKLAERRNSSARFGFRLGLWALIVTVVAELMLICGLGSPIFGLFALFLRIVTLPTERLCQLFNIEFLFNDSFGLIWPTFLVPPVVNTTLYFFVGFVAHKALGRLCRFFWPERRRPPDATTIP